MEQNLTLQAVDYVVTILMLLIPLGIGILFAVRDSKRATRDEYLLGGRRMAMLPVTLSIFVSFMSAITLIGAPTEIYTYGATYALVHVGFSLSFIIGMFTVVPLMYPLHLTSVYEYLELRFQSSLVRRIIVAIGILQTTCYMAVALLTPALCLQATAGVPLWLSLAIVGIIGTIYTAIGGIKSVVWTDAFQCCVMFAGIIAIIIKGSATVGGVNAAWEIAETDGRTSVTEWSFDPRTRLTGWGSVLGATFTWLANVFGQSSVQRISSMQTLKDAKRSMLLNVPLMIGYGVLATCFGVILYAYFDHLRCDPYEAGFITNRNQLPPYFVMHVARDMPGIAGLYMATLFSGGLSTLSSGINALAANTVEDMLKRPLSKVKESTATLITKIIAVVYGGLIIGLAYAAKSVKGTVTQMTMSVFGACGGPIVGVFFLAASVPWANTCGAIIGAVIALAFNIWIAMGNQLYGKKVKTLTPPPTDMCFSNSSTVSLDTDVSSWLSLQNNTDHLFVNSTIGSTTAFSEYKDPYEFGFFLYDMSYEWYGFTGTFLSFVLGLFISFCTRNYIKSSPDPRLIFPILRKFWSLPEPLHMEADESNLKAVENLKLSAAKIEKFNRKEISVHINSDKGTKVNA